MSRKKKHKKHENRISNTPETSKKNGPDGSTLKKNYMEVFPLMSSIEPYIQSMTNAIIPILLLANTGLAFQIITPNKQEELSLFNFFTGGFLLSILVYGFALLEMFRLKRNILEKVEYNKINFDVIYKEIKSSYKFFFKMILSSIIISLITFAIGVEIILSLYKTYNI